MSLTLSNPVKLYLTWSRWRSKRSKTATIHKLGGWGACGKNSFKFDCNRILSIVAIHSTVSVTFELNPKDLLAVILIRVKYSNISVNYKVMYIYSFFKQIWYGIETIFIMNFQNLRFPMHFQDAYIKSETHISLAFSFVSSKFSGLRIFHNRLYLQQGEKWYSMVLSINSIQVKVKLKSLWLEGQNVREMKESFPLSIE